MVEPTAGEVFIDGADVLQASKAHLTTLRRDKLGMVFQHFGLFPHMTVVNNVAFPLKMRGEKLSARQERAREVVKLVGLEGREDAYPRELSGGQRQRVGIARSLAVDPDIWFLDEPFSALDPLIRRQLQDEFLSIQANIKKSIVFITHDFDEALRLADRIAIMKDGAVEQCDTPDKIVLNPHTEYVRKFTEEVPREKVLRIESVMEAFDPAETISNLSVSKDAVIETVAESVLNTEKPVAVTDASGATVGVVRAAKVVNLLFGGRSEQAVGQAAS